MIGAVYSTSGGTFSALTDTQLLEEINTAVEWRDWDYYAALTAEEQRRGL